jgi:hypothetical protein
MYANRGFETTKKLRKYAPALFVGLVHDFFLGIVA